jgi:Ca2+-binding RTX toxin-like protein
VSPNGASVYVASGNDASITRFNRTSGTGALSHQGCITRETGTSTCTILSGNQANGFNTGFDNLRAVVVSQDGASLYTVGGGDSSIVHFSRNTGDGALAFQGCLTGEQATGSTGTGDCSDVTGATPTGENSGWNIANTPPELAISASGAAVYFGTGADDSVVQLDRNATTGALTYRRCLSSETESSAVCTVVSPAASFGADTALNSVNSLALSQDGSSLYTTSFFSDAVARFSVEPAPNAPSGPVPSPQFCAGKQATIAGHRATIAGTAGPDKLTGTSKADVIAGLGGNDTIRGLRGNDTICGGAGKDKLLGGRGNDKLLGQAGKDTLKGGAGKDKLKGGAGKDVQIQ